MKNSSDIKIFPGSASEEFTRKICGHMGAEMGKCRQMRFSDGNIYVKIEEKVRGMDVYVVQTIGTDPNNEFMELLFWLDAFRRASVNSVTAIIPYFGYAKADKKDEPRVSIRARVCADCIESAGAVRVVTMDLHSPQIQGFFRVPVDHLYGSNIFCEYIENGDFEDFVIVSPDEGFAKNARQYSNKFGVPLAICSKQRKYHDENAEVLGLIGDVAGKNAIIVDDFTISCGTLCEAARALKENGAKKIYAFVSHSLLSDAAVERLNSSDIFRLITTDTIESRYTVKTDKIEILSASALFAQAISIIHKKESLGELFE